MVDATEVAEVPVKRKPRHRHECLRCGYRWGGYKEHPGACARCHTVNWNYPPLHKDARHPEDAPSERWRKSGQRKQNKVVGAEPRRAEKSLVAMGPRPEDEMHSAEMPTASIPFSGLTPPPNLSSGLTPPPRLANQRFVGRAEDAPQPEQLSSHRTTEEVMPFAPKPNDEPLGREVAEGGDGASEETSRIFTPDDEADGIVEQGDADEENR